MVTVNALQTSDSVQKIKHNLRIFEPEIQNPVSMFEPVVQNELLIKKNCRSEQNITVDEK